MTISAQERSKLIDLANRGVAAAVNRQSPPEITDASGVLGERRGCFVTLHNAAELRGCIGTFHPHGPLGEMVVEMAGQAAHDPRFVGDPITPEELSDLTVEVSVLSPLVETAEPEKLQLGVHGIYIVGPGGAGCFLPEVATDQRWTATEFLDFCCTHKAGLPAGAWRKPGTKVYLFTSEKFEK